MLTVRRVSMLLACLALNAAEIASAITVTADGPFRWIPVYRWVVVGLVLSEALLWPRRRTTASPAPRVPHKALAVTSKTTTAFPADRQQASASVSDADMLLLAEAGPDDKKKVQRAATDSDIEESVAESDDVAATVEQNGDVDKAATMSEDVEEYVTEHEIELPSLVSELDEGEASSSHPTVDDDELSTESITQMESLAGSEIEQQDTATEADHSTEQEERDEAGSEVPDRSPNVTFPPDIVQEESQLASTHCEESPSVQEGACNDLMPEDILPPPPAPSKLMQSEGPSSADELPAPPREMLDEAHSDLEQIPSASGEKHANISVQRPAAKGAPPPVPPKPTFFAFRGLNSPLHSIGKTRRVFIPVLPPPFQPMESPRGSAGVSGEDEVHARAQPFLSGEDMRDNFNEMEYNASFPRSFVKVKQAEMASWPKSVPVSSLRSKGCISCIHYEEEPSANVADDVYAFSKY